MKMCNSLYSKLAVFSVVLLCGSVVARCGDNHTAESDPYKAGLVAAVEALKNAGDVSRKEESKRDLLRYLLHPDLPSFSDVIIPFLTDVTNETSCLLLGRLNISEETRKLLLTAESSPTIVRARMGDQVCETEIIRRFRETSNDVHVREGCKDILYIDSERTKRAFIEALKSRELLFGRYSTNDYSRAYIALRCYTMVVPSLALLSTAAIEEHGVNNIDEFQQDVHQLYLKRISAYFTEKFGQEVIIAPSLFYIIRPPEVHYVSDKAKDRPPTNKVEGVLKEQ